MGARPSAGAGDLLKSRVYDESVGASMIRGALPGPIALGIARAGFVLVGIAWVSTFRPGRALVLCLRGEWARAIANNRFERQ